MPKLAANLHYLFNEVAFLDRFAAAADAGFEAVEFQVPYDWPADVLAGHLRRNKLKMAMLDTPAGDWAAGERGLTALPGRQEEFRAGVERAAQYCETLGCGTVHVIAGVVPNGIDPAAAERVYLENLRHAADRLAGSGVRAVIEPINSGRDLIRGGETYTTYGMPGFFLTSTQQALRFIRLINSRNLFLHLDFYHMQLTEGHLAETIRHTIDLLRHVQIAGVPDRAEPSRGEVNYPYLLDLLDELGYDGWVGCEYRPAAGTMEGLGWAARYGIGPERRRSRPVAGTAA